MIAKTKSEGRYLVRLSLKLNVFNITFLLTELGTVMMRLNEFPTEDELKVMVAEVDQVGTIVEKKQFFHNLGIHTVLYFTHMYEVSSKANANQKIYQKIISLT